MSICIAVIPARLGSTRLPRKVLAPINGHTLNLACVESSKAGKRPERGLRSH